jgi:hypothetical protein
MKLMTSQLPAIRLSTVGSSISARDWFQPAKAGQGNTGKSKKVLA